MFYPYKTSTHRSGSDTTVGFVAYKTKNFLREKTPEGPRSNLEDERQRVAWVLEGLTLEDTKRYEIKSRWWCGRTLADLKIVWTIVPVLQAAALPYSVTRTVVDDVLSPFQRGSGCSRSSGNPSSTTVWWWCWRNSCKASRSEERRVGKECRL